jgi:hypothetical protein
MLKVSFEDIEGFRNGSLKIALLGISQRFFVFEKIDIWVGQLSFALVTFSLF